MSELIPLTFLDKVEVAFADMKARIIAELGETTHLHYAVQEAKESIFTATAEHFPPTEETPPPSTGQQETKTPTEETPGTENKGV